MALQHGPRLGPQSPTVVAFLGVRGRAGAPSAAFMRPLFYVELHLMDRNTLWSDGQPGHLF